ncbi:four helix bundle protein [candidate division WOR-3 bacterium]|nr:four helix bundle protein [candidate division WOR-3 bacterium]
MAEIAVDFPREERYALADDLLRAARSISSNISEGFGRYHFAEKIQFFNISKGSVSEVQNHLIEAKNNGYLSEDEYTEYSKRYHVVEVKINNLIASTMRARRKYTKTSKK